MSGLALFNARIAESEVAVEVLRLYISENQSTGLESAARRAPRSGELKTWETPLSKL